MLEAIDEHVGRLMRKVEWLNLMFNVGPLLGLLGTVLGMIMCFFVIVEKREISETIAMSDITEEVVVFYALDTRDGFSTVSETVLLNAMR